jgi:peptidyl-dipeptidase Dcp
MFEISFSLPQQRTKKDKSGGNTRDAMEMFVNFRGREPVIEPLLRQRGILK